MKATSERKRTDYAKLVYRLRQDIDLYRVIGLNVRQLSEHGRSNAFWGYLEMLAHQSIAATTCKLFEREDRYERNSIPALISGLPDSAWTPEQIESVVRFAAKYGASSKFSDMKSHLWCALYCFECSNRKALDDLIEFRNKHVAHSQGGYKLSPLPSIDSFEQIFAFTNDFYRVVSDALFGVVPVVIYSPVGRGAIKVMKALEIADLQYDFKE
jgi:AbiU2